MYRVLTFNILLFAAVLSAQPYQAARLAEPSYGIDGGSVIQDFDLVNGNIYANLQAIYDDAAAGPLSRVDLVTGRAMAISFPANDQAFRSTIGQAGEQTFINRRDFRKGSSLYLLEEGQTTATRLLQRDGREFRGYTEFNGHTYFIADHAPDYGDADLTFPFEYDNMLGAELWRTDGTPEGTVLLETFPAHLQNTLNLHPGASRILIKGSWYPIDSPLSVVFMYDPDLEALATFPNGNNARTIRYLPSNLVVYSGGQFYCGSPSDRYSPVNDAFVLTIDEERLTVVGAALPVAMLNGNALPKYQNMELALIRDSVYLIAYRNQQPVGYDLYQVRPGEEWSFVPLGDPSITPAPGGLQVTSVVRDSVLYFLSPTGAESANLRSFHPSDATPQLLASISVPGRYAYCRQAGRHVYVTSRETDHLVRYDLTTNVQEDLDLEFSPSENSFFSPDPLRVTDTGAYYLSSGKGLRFWAADENTDTAFGDFFTCSNNLTPNLLYQVDAGENWLLLTDLLKKVSASNGIITPVNAERIPEDHELRPLVRNDEHSIFTAHSRTDNQESVSEAFRLDGDRLVSTNILFDGEPPVSEFKYTKVKQLNDGRAVVYFRPRFRSSILSLAEAGPEGNLNILPLISLDDGFPGNFFDTTFFTLRYPGNDPVADLLDYDGNLLRTATTRDFCRVTATTEQEMFAVCAVYPSLTFSYHLLARTDQEERTFISEGKLMIPYESEVFYAVGERIVFVADHEVHGVEWFVADVASMEIQLLSDVAPGADFGATFDGAVYHDGDRGVYFQAIDDVHGAELWFTDGTPGGTYMVEDINPGPGSSNPKSFLASHRSLYFSAKGPFGEETYRLNLDDRSVELFIDLAPGAASSWPYGFQVADGNFYFFGRAAAGQTYDLYTLDLSVAAENLSLTSAPARVYPNPTGQHPVVVEAPEGETFTALELFNAAGQKLRSLEASGNRATIEMRDLPAGTYWLRARYAGNRYSINAVTR